MAFEPFESRVPKLLTYPADVQLPFLRAVMLLIGACHEAPKKAHKTASARVYGHKQATGLQDLVSPAEHVDDLLVVEVVKHCNRPHGIKGLSGQTQLANLADLEVSVRAAGLSCPGPRTLDRNWGQFVPDKFR